MDLHHVHVFASDIDHTLGWWQRHLGARVLFDGKLEDARCVLIGVGSGRITIYDQPQREPGWGAAHHLCVRVADVRTRWQRLQASGVTSPNGIREQNDWRYVVISAPDDVLVELFEFDDPSSPFNNDG